MGIELPGLSLYVVNPALTLGFAAVFALLVLGTIAAPFTVPDGAGQP